MFSESFEGQCAEKELQANGTLNPRIRSDLCRVILKKVLVESECSS